MTHVKRIGDARSIADSRGRGTSRKIQRIFIPGPAGRLEAMLEWEPETAPQLALSVCHPHSLHGGTMHNRVVFHAAKAAHEVGIPVIRFNFRGVGQSEGEYAEGIGEKDDVRASLDFIEAQFPKTPLGVVGFSFGAWVGLAAGAQDPRVCVLAGLGLPTASLDFSYLREVRKPKLIIQATRDAFGPRVEVEALFSTMAEPKRLCWIEDADHFFAGKLEEVQAALSTFLRVVVAVALDAP